MTKISKAKRAHLLANIVELQPIRIVKMPPMDPAKQAHLLAAMRDMKCFALPADFDLRLIAPRSIAIAKGVGGRRHRRRRQSARRTDPSRGASMWRALAMPYMFKRFHARDHAW